MFDRIIALLESGAPQSGYDSHDIAAAVAGLYFHMIAVDGVVTPAEMSEFRAILANQFRFRDAELDAVIERGIAEVERSPGIFPFTSILNREFSDSEKRQMLVRLGQLANADGERHPMEIEMLDHVVRLLNMS